MRPFSASRLRSVAWKPGVAVSGTIGIASLVFQKGWSTTSGRRLGSKMSAGAGLFRITFVTSISELPPEFTLFITIFVIVGTPSTVSIVQRSVLKVRPAWS